MDAQLNTANESSFDTEYIFPKNVVNSSIPTRLYDVVNTYPHRVALKFGESEFTYEQFNRKSNQLAYLIREQNQKTGNPIAFLLKNGADSILAIIAILKAGGGYLPLDPSFPLDRIAFMVADAGVETILTDNENFELSRTFLPAHGRLIRLDQTSSSTPSENLDLEYSPDWLACLHYTSGSTGKPKGVPQTHRNILHAAWVSVSTNKINPKDRIALLSSTGYAASVLPIFGTLLSGACLFPFEMKENLPDLVDWLGEERITIFSGVATLFRHFAMNVRENQEFPHLRLITSGGEAVLKSDVELYKKHFSRHSQFRHGIGGTEMQAYRYYYIDRDTQIQGELVPVGYPVEDKEVLIVDQDGNLLGPDEVGEIVIRSRYLSPGYWRRPELTLEKFKDDPDHPGKRLYWTGDLGRMEADGCLYHLGRKDFQIKIRGFRVELGEIESKLMQHTHIQEAAVLADEHPTSGKRLVAYLVLSGGSTEPSSEELRLYLKQELPDFMIPNTFVILESMPLTPTGKINRLELPALEEVYDLAKDYIPPQTEAEKKLVAIWEKELGVSPIGIKHDFFDLGGYSLLAANVVIEIERSFNTQVDISLLSERPTIQQLAQALSFPAPASNISSLVQIQNSDSRPPLFCVHGVGGHVLPFTLLAKYLGPHQPVIGLQIDRILEKFGYSYTIETIANEYINDIKEYFPQGPYYLSGFSFGGFVAYEMARQLAEQELDVQFVGFFDTQVAAAPKYRLSLSRRRFLQYKVKSYMTKIKYHGDNMINMSPDQMRSYWKRRNQVPNPEQAIMGDVHPDQVPRPMQKVISSNLLALRKYIPGEYSGKVVLFRSRDHGMGVYYGWDELVHGGVEVFSIPGTHRGILQEPNVAVLAEHLRMYLDKTIPS